VASPLVIPLLTAGLIVEVRIVDLNQDGKPEFAVLTEDNQGGATAQRVTHVQLKGNTLVTREVAPTEPWWAPTPPASAPAPAPQSAGTLPSAEPHALGTVLTDLHRGDLDGDGIMDRLEHRSVAGSSTPTAVGHLAFRRGTAQGLGPVQVHPTQPGAQHAYPVDLDNDGDQDILVPCISQEPMKVAQSVLTRRAQATLVVHPMQDGRLGPAVTLHEVTLPLSLGQAAWSMFGDHDGDGFVDLATAINGELRVYPGHGLTMQAAPSVVVPFTSTISNLWASDLDGDGVAELIGWAKGENNLVVVRLR
jgi:hypothetical protein